MDSERLTNSFSFGILIEDEHLEIGIVDIYENMKEVDIASAKTDLYEIEKSNWKNNINNP